MCCFTHIQFFYFVLGKPFSPTESLNNAVSNIISSMVYGSRFEYSDPAFTRMAERAKENIQLSGSPSMQVTLCLSLDKP